MPKRKSTKTTTLKIAKKKEPKTKLGNKKVEIDGILFDSKLESQYYLELKKLQKEKKIHHFECQPEYVLMEAFTKSDKKYRKMTYTADFKIYINETDFYLVDTKGFETEAFKLKEKLFNYIYRDIELKLLNYDAITDQWLELKELKKLRKERKKK